MLRREFGEPVLRRSCADAEWMPAGRGLPPHLAAARDAFGAYMRGDNDALACLQLDTRGRSPFTARVLEIVKGIPAGQVMSYGEVAAAVGRPGGARAVGQTMARNVLAPVVPCHRVIAAGGGLGGFGSGLPRKMALLEQEGVSIDATAQKVAGRK
jgi:methylated-DNA-[protein]-cysteine S-methyltransferase